MRVQECGKREWRPVIGRIGIQTLSHAKAGRLPHGLRWQGLRGNPNILTTRGSRKARKSAQEIGMIRPGGNV